jgi:hypothetical protein
MGSFQIYQTRSREAMTVKTVKLQLERALEEIALLKEKIAILEDTIVKLKALNHIQEIENYNE